MKCPKCQSDNPYTQTFCGDCGTQLILVEDAHPAFTKTLETPVEELTRGTVLFIRKNKTEEEESYFYHKDNNPTTNIDEQQVCCYPNFSRHGKNSLLKQYLTPAVYAALADKRTRLGIQLEDIIRAGVALPWGAQTTTRNCWGILW